MKCVRESTLLLLLISWYLTSRVATTVLLKNALDPSRVKLFLYLFFFYFSFKFLFTLDDLEIPKTSAIFKESKEVRYNAKGLTPFVFNEEMYDQESSFSSDRKLCKSKVDHTFWGSLLSCYTGLLERFRSGIF